MFGLYVNNDLFMISNDAGVLLEQVAYLSMDDDATITRIDTEEE